MAVKAWLWNILIGIDQLVNAILGGWPDETLSARAYRKSRGGRRGWRSLRRLIDLAFFWDKNHCRESWLSEIRGTQTAVEYRRKRIGKKGKERI